MQDWTVALKNFRYYMEALTSGSSNLESSTSDSAFSLIRSICSNLKQGTALLAIANVQVTALLLKAIWKV
jgi:hypothetical protein